MPTARSCRLPLPTQQLVREPKILTWSTTNHQDRFAMCANQRVYYYYDCLHSHFCTLRAQAAENNCKLPLPTTRTSRHTYGNYLHSPLPFALFYSSCHFVCSFLSRLGICTNVIVNLLKSGWAYAACVLKFCWCTTHCKNPCRLFVLATSMTLSRQMVLASSLEYRYRYS